MDFIRDEADALMQYGFHNASYGVYAVPPSEAEQDAVRIEMEIEDNAMTDDEIAADCARRQSEAESFNQAINYFLVDWSGL